ncbi:hypothetical protein D3C86_608070 [compost metagenome]
MSGLSRSIQLPDGRFIDLRRAGPDDSDAIFALYDQVYQGSYTLDIVNKPAERLTALSDPNHYWLVVDDGQAIIGSVILEIDTVQRNGKVFAAVMRDDYRRYDLMSRLIGMGIQKIMYDDRLCDVIYATTRTASIGPRQLLKKLGFISLGIFPNVHRLAEYETHGLSALFHPDAWEKRRRLPKLIPEVEGFYRIIRQTFHLEPAEIMPAKHQPKLKMIRGDAVETELLREREAGGLLMDFFPFHKANFLFANDDRSVMAFVNYEGKDGYGTLVALKSPIEDLRGVLEASFDMGQRIGIVYLELLVDAYKPRMQRAALAAQFLPCAYFPSMQQTDEDRKDYLVFARSTLPLNFSNVQMTPRDREFLDHYLQNTEFRNLVVKMHFTGPLDEGRL